jgi:hypothetical protein
MLKGTLDDFALPDIFRLVMVARRTGKLDIARSAGSGKVFFRDGEVYYAESTVAREPLGQKLIRSGALTEGGLLKALDESASTGERVGEILVRNGSISVDQLQEAVRNQIEDSVFDLLRWDLGEFSWESNVIADVEVPISVSVENLIMESSRRLDELEVILRKIPSEKAVPAMASAPPEGAVEINITPQEWRMLVLVNGVRTIHDIAEQVGLDDFSVMRSIYGLLSAGLVEMADLGEDADTPAPVVEEISPAQQAARSDDEPAAEAEVAFEVETIAVEMADDTAMDIETEIEDETGSETESEEPAAEDIFAEALEDVLAEVDADPDAGSETADVDLEIAIALAQAEDAADDDDSIYRDAFVAEATENADSDSLAAFEAAREGKISFESFTDAPVSSNGSKQDEDNVIFMSSGEEEDGDAEAPEESRRFEVLSGSAADDEDTAAVDESDPLGAGWEPSVVGFDAPEGDELTTVTPEDDPFLDDLFGGGVKSSPPAPPSPEVAPEAPAPAASAPEAPASSDPESPQVDRAAVVRELAGLFSDEDRPRSRTAPAATEKSGEEEADQRKRVEDDDQVTKGLISRLIDGVKGL